MILEEIKQLKSGSRELRKFGLIGTAETAQEEERMSASGGRGG